MSTPRSAARPPARRPVSPGVYRRRRIMVAATTVLLVVAGVNLVKGDDPGPSDTARQVVGTPTAQPSDTTSDTPTDTPATGNGKKKKRKQQQETAPPEPVYTPPPPAEPDGPCADADVVVTPVMAPALAGRSVLVTLQLRTRESEACTWTIGRSHLAYRITDADGDDVWSSSECPAQVPDDEIVVRRALTATYRLAWNGRESSRDCPSSMESVVPGDYAVQAAAIGGEPSAIVSFTLTDPADVAPVAPIGPPVPETEPDKDRSKGKNKAKGRSKGKNKPAGPTPD